MSGSNISADRSVTGPPSRNLAILLPLWPVVNVGKEQADPIEVARPTATVGWVSRPVYALGQPGSPYYGGARTMAWEGEAPAEPFSAAQPELRPPIYKRTN